MFVLPLRRPGLWVSVSPRAASLRQADTWGSHPFPLSQLPSCSGTFWEMVPESQLGNVVRSQPAGTEGESRAESSNPGIPGGQGGSGVAQSLKRQGPDSSVGTAPRRSPEDRALRIRALSHGRQRGWKRQGRMAGDELLVVQGRHGTKGMCRDYGIWGSGSVGCVALAALLPECAGT